MGKMLLVEREMPLLKLSGAFIGIKASEVGNKIRLLAKKYPEVRLDLREIEFLDSGVLGAILGQALLLKKENKKLTIIIDSDPDSYISSIFEVSNLELALGDILRMDREPGEE